MKAPVLRSSSLALSLAVAAVPLSCKRSATGPEAEPSSPPDKLAQTNAAATVLTGKDGMVLANVAERAMGAVVSVASTRVAKVESPESSLQNPLDNPLFRRFFGPFGGGQGSPFPTPPGEAPEQHGLGSGVIVGKDLILTNAHVVEDAKELEVTTGDRRLIQAKLIGADPKSDLAVLRITGDTSGLKSLDFADSSRVRLGQVVLAIGNPFGVGQTVTMGIISAKGRADLGIEAYEDFIQTDAAINPGNSGGALVDLDGNLVGVPTAILSRTGGYIGVGFAIPSNMAKPIMTSLVEHGRVVRGYLGVAIQNVDADLAKALGLPSADGVLISEVKANGPADKAGLKRGDVVLSIGNQPVHTTGQLRNLVAATGANVNTKLEIIRQGKRQPLDVKLGEMPDEEGKEPGTANAAPSGKAGLGVAPLDGSLRQRLSVPPDIKGVVVTSVDPGSPAARAGIRAGDVIVQLNQQPITTPDQLAHAWDGSSGNTPALIFRDGHTFFAVIKH